MMLGHFMVEWSWQGLLRLGTSSLGLNSGAAPLRSLSQIKCLCVKNIPFNSKPGEGSGVTETEQTENKQTVRRQTAPSKNARFLAGC